MFSFKEYKKFIDLRLIRLETSGGNSLKIDIKNLMIIDFKLCIIKKNWFVVKNIAESNIKMHKKGLHILNRYISLALRV